MQVNAKVTRDTVVAGASVQRTPRVGIVLSSYKGGPDHFGNAKFEGLTEPRPPGQELTAAQIGAMTRRAVELGNHPNPGFRRIVGRNESVLLLVNRYTEPAVVSAVIDTLKRDAEGSKFSILSADAARFSGAESLDIAKGQTVRMPAPGIWSRRDVEYRIPRAILECDRLITVAPLRIENGRPSLTLDNYRSLAPGEAGTNDSRDLTAMDLFGFHPAEYAVLGGTHVLRDGSKVRHNLVLAGPMPAAVDTVGAAILKLKPEEVRVLKMAGKRGFGEPNLDVVWVMGNEIEDARM
jgi:hypothetical protein